MKTTRVLVIFAGAVLAAASGWGQSVDFITVTRSQLMVQTSTGPATADPTTPFEFTAEVNGSDMTGSSPLTAASVIYPSTSSQALTPPNINNSNWRYRSGAYSSLANLLSAFPNGAYTMSLTGDGSHPGYTGTTSVALTDPTSSLVAVPLLTITGGAGDGWSGGVYLFDPSHTLTISFNPAFTGSPGLTQSFHYDAGIFGTSDTSAVDQPQGFVHWDPTANSGAGGTVSDTIPSFIINANQLVSGGSYTLEAGYDDVQTFNIGALGAQASAGLFEIRTQLTLQAIPEPSTYAAIFGVVVLVGVMIQRRRLQAA